MVGPLRVLAVGLTVATTEVEDIDGGLPRGCWQQGPTATTTKVEDVDDGPLGGAGGKVQQRSPLNLKTLIAAPLGVLVAGLAAATTKVEDVDGGPPGGCWW
jgi:hypothetical protein